MSLPNRAAPPGVLVPDWPAPESVHAAFTLRSGGVSAPPYDSLNIGAHVGDVAAAVAENRRRVSAHLKLPSEPLWLEQVHGIEVLDLDAASSAAPAAAPPNPPMTAPCSSLVPGKFLQPTALSKKLASKLHVTILFLSI